MSSETKETEIADDSPGAKSSEPPLGTDLQDDPSTSEIGGAGDAPVQAPEGFLNTKSVIQDTIVKPEASSDKSSPKTLDDPVTKDSTSNQGLRSDDGFHSVNPSEEKNYETIDKTFEKGSGDTVIETSSPGARQSINEDTKGNPQHGSGDGLHVSNQSKEPHQIIDQVLDTDVGDDAQNVIPSSEKSFVEEDIANHISTNEVDSINQAEKEDDLVIDKILATNSGDTRDIISSSVDEKSIRDRTVDDLESSGNVVVQSSNKSEDQVDQSNIIHIDTKMMSNKLLEPVSRSASPKTPISADEFGSDDLVLKWDDDEESEGQSSGNEKPKINDDHHNSNMDVDFPENEEKNDKKNTSDDLIKQLDQQISELDNTASKKDDAESDHVDDSIDDQVNPTELFKNQDSKTDIQNKETLSYPKIPSPNSNTKQFKTDFENDIETNTSGVCVDNLIKTLDSVLNEEKETKVNEKSEKLQEGSAEKEAADTVISESVFLPEIGKSKANINENKKACVSDSEVSEAVLGNVIEEMDVEHNEKPFAENDGILDAKAVANSTAIEIDQEINKTSDNLSETLQSSDDTFIAPREHNLNKTDMMLEIPTQEIIDCLDESIEMSKVEEPVSMEVSETSETVSKNKVDEPVSMEVSDTSETVSKNKVDENITDDNNSLCSLPAENTNEIESQKDCQPTPQQIEIKTAEDSSQSEQEVVIETKISNINTNTEALQNEFKSNNFEIEKEIIAEPDTEVVGELEKELSETPTELKNADNSETRPIIEEHNETISDVSPSKADLTYEEETKVPESVTPKPKDQINEVDKELGKEKLSPKPVNQTIKDVISESDSQVPKIEDSLSTLAEQGTNVTDNIGEITHETDDKTGSNDVCTTDVSTTKEVTQIPSKSGVSAATPEEIQNNQMLADTSDEVLEVTDSLGLLAESSRVVEDDDDQETSDRDEGDDDDDFDPDDESSNQMTAAEMSEDSNLQAFESDLPKVKLLDDENAQDYLDKDLGTPPDGLSTLSEAINASDTAVLETDIEEPSIEDFINKVDEISEVDAEMLEDVEALSPIDAQSPSDIQSPAADELESDKEFNFSISNVVSETDGMKDAEKLTDVGDAKHNKAKLSKDSMGLEDNIDVNSTDAVLKSQTLITDEETKAAVESLTGESQTLEPVILKELLSKDLAPSKLPESPSKASKLEVSKPKNVISIVDLGESSSEDDVQETPQPTPGPSDVTMTSDATPVDTAKTSDPKIKSRSPAVESKDTDAKSNEAVKDTVVFNLDSDEEDRTAAPEPTPEPTHINKCINNSCTSDTSARFYAADRLAVSYYEPNRKRKGVVCEECAATVAERTQRLIDGVKNLTPLLDMDMGRPCQDLVEISDSDSDSEPDPAIEDQVLLGAKEATQVEERLVNMINETWEKFKMDSRLDDTQAELSAELERLDKESKEIDLMLRECQAATDKLRTELYATFEPEIKQLPGLIIFDTPDTVFTHPEKVEESQLKRRLSSSSEKPPSKRPSLSSTNIVQDAASKTPSQEIKDSTEAPDHKIDDDKDVSVVNLSAESAPPDLPPAGNVTRPPLRTGMAVYAMRNVFGSWLKGRVFEIMPRGSAVGSSVFTMCRIKFESKSHKNQYKMLPARCLAYSEPADVRMTIGTRLIALFKDPMGESKREAYYSGIVAEVPNPVNSYRYLVFFDDGYAQYVRHRDTRLVCECSLRVWEEVHPFSREFVRDYLTNYPERPMVRLHPGQKLKTEWNGKWWSSRVIKVDASLVQVHFENDNRTEWMYRGSTRLEPLYLELQNAERQRNRAMPRNRTQNKVNMPYVEYTRSDEATAKVDTAAQDQSRQEEARRAQRAVAKKSVGGLPPPPQPQPPAAPDTVTSRVVYYTPKNAVKPYKMVTHNCGPKCKRTDVLKLHELRTYNPLAKPLLSGWERQLVRYKGHKEVMYRAPCGRRLRNIRELHRYLRLIQSDMGVDLFDFSPNTHCLAEFVLNKCIIAKKDLSNGKENVPVPCVNYYDNSLPEFCSYNTERTPTDGVPLNLDPDFLCGCDCTDDCEDKSKCACWQLTLEGARTIGLSTRNVGYSYKRLPQPLPSGIYECNSRCKCKSTCLNRVAQHPLQLKLQVFKTLNRGWGIRALNDVPKGAFLCVYAGNLLTDATANLDGLNEGDEYLAELDYIEVVEQMKEGYEEDVPENDKKLDGKDQEDGESTEEESEEEAPSKNEKEDGDFEVPYMNVRSEFRKTLRKRDRKEKQDQKDGNGNEKTKDKDSAGKEGDEDCITISDDEEVREPSRFTAQAGMGSEFKSKYRSVRSYFGKDEACYIMDAKVQGNIGRYLNHSCSPNVFVQNVFVDTHDPRFPWVAFFALLPIRAGTELTWNYNYDVGSVPGKVLYCYCGAANCRGRLL